MNLVRRMCRLMKRISLEMWSRLLVFFRGLKYGRKDSINIGILVESLDKGGLEQVVFNLATNLGNRKPYIFIRSGKYGLNALKLKEKGFEVFAFKNDGKAFLKILKEKNIEVINSHYSVGNLQEIHQLGIKIVYTIHSNYTWIDNPEDINYREVLYNSVDKFIAVSSNVKEYFSAKFDISKLNIEVINNGFDIREFENSQKPFKTVNDSDKFVFLNVGSFNPVKNHLLMLSAFKEISETNKEAYLWFVGNNYKDEYYKKVLGTIEDFNLSGRVKIVDFIKKNELAKIYKEASCFLLPSLQEGCANVLLEAMYFGLPVIASDVGASREILHNSGIIIPNSYEDLLKENTKSLYSEAGIAYSSEQKNKIELVEAMSEIQNNYNYWVKKAQRSSKLISRKYGIKAMVKEYRKVFKNVLLNDLSV